MKKELPSWVLPAGIIAAVVILAGGIWALMAGPRPVNPQDLPPIESPAPPPPPGG